MMNMTERKKDVESPSPMSEKSGSAARAKAQITLQEKVDIQHLQNANGQRRQDMQGFDPRFADIVDFILGITHEIWEEKSVGKLYDYYANTVRIHTSDGTIYGREAVLASTLATLAAYPDRRLYGDEVIWGGDDQQGFYSSHRLLHSGTNRGYSQYGPPTGRSVEYYAIADCFCRQNMVIEEWLVRDELTLVHQLGLNPVETAKEFARREAERGTGMQIDADIERGIGQLPPPAPSAASAFAPESFVIAAIQDIWNRRLVNAVRQYCAQTVRLEAPSLRRLSGVNDYQGYVLSLLAPFPDLAIRIEHSCHVGDAEVGYRVATRWRMMGTHSGFGMYGEPTGQRIHILGMSHYLLREGEDGGGPRIESEWTVFDEFALLKQIHRPQE